MAALNYYKIAKFFLLIPIITGTISMVELFLPLEKITTVVDYKRISERKRFGTTTHSIDFVTYNDQFTEEIYNAVNEGDTVNLEVLRFSKEVRTLQLKNKPVIMENATNEVYFQIGMSLAFIGLAVFFIRKGYYTNTNYRYIVFLCVISFGSLIRILSLNS